MHEKLPFVQYICEGRQSISTFGIKLIFMKQHTKFQISLWVIVFGITIGVASHFMPLQKALIITMVSLFFYAAIFYLNTLFIFPKLYKSENSRPYFVVIFFISLVFSFLHGYTELSLSKTFGPMPEHLKFPLLAMTTRSFFWIIFMNAVGTIYLIQNRLQKRELYHQKLEKDKINTELKLLKAQINPHFLFNALNNIFSLSYMKSDKAPESVLKLSGMLRYVIEDCVNETVPIQKEIEYIKNYLAFQMMKSPEEMNINFQTEEVKNTLQIAPLLLIPFIENSFKYSKIEEFPSAFIDIRMGTDNKKQFWFSINNSIPPVAKVPSGSGLGIENVKQRLKLIYPDKHSIQIEEAGNTFEVHIKIKLS